MLIGKSVMLNCKQKTKGYSLIELVITITLTSIVIVLFYSYMSQQQLRSVSPVIQVKAAQLAQAYLEEISLKRYDENSPAGNAQRCNSPAAAACSAALGNEGETRALFDDIDDFNGLNESPPRDALDNIRSGFTGFSVSATVTYAGGDFGLAAQDMKRVELTVTTPEGTPFVFSQYKGNF
ncbi:prepilin-type N-terminal cleavage/methylation domain-containing protein [Aliikangiella marina]|uniref:Prepilin-type N-terminal cleavage/methylation domain-containing protein n=1 Tax=Aliikangiella marina TaxID=1712262 RepID=A0A545T4E6_9GAMM|nr:prepilin-type N-terminal cleavage/methylation domain-containing protein [Aliikangiella marina]TQV71985.1 prepilin-type N-terminal cleavage/methylation domain-containing protein [Aliikangiella marina]TQV72038.1 prepilin-type N-terminal cleavage/methylation domain-containing protein [Aliikangiella marina]